MPKAKSQENKENATVESETKPADYKLEEGKDDESGEESEESDDENEGDAQQPVNIYFVIAEKKTFISFYLETKFFIFDRFFEVSKND
jgi:hypothetical protein